jgi:hypothetical protein
LPTTTKTGTSWTLTTKAVKPLGRYHGQRKNLPSSAGSGRNKIKDNAVISQNSMEYSEAREALSNFLYNGCR